MRMKNFIGLLLSLCLLFSLTACGCNSGNTAAEESTSRKVEKTVTEAESEADEYDGQASNEDASAETSDVARQISEEQGDGSNVLVVYFSRTGEQYGVGVINKGNTAIVAEMIAEETGADTFEILPENDIYPTTYDELTDVAKQEQNENARPAIAGELPDLSQYDTIFIGAPVWWGDWPMICYTYFEANDFSGKTLVPFSTHAGSGLSGFDRKLESAAPGAKVLTGLAVAGTDAQNHQDTVRGTVSDWISGLGF